MIKTKETDLNKKIEDAVRELGKFSTAPDKEFPTWMEADIRRGIKKGIEIGREEYAKEVCSPRWVKASERLPRIGIYNALFNGDHAILQVHDGGFRIVLYDGSFIDRPTMNYIKWLEESNTEGEPSTIKNTNYENAKK